MQIARMDEAQAGIKTAGRNINNLRHAEDNTPMVESEEKLKSLLMKGKEESEKAGLKLHILKPWLIHVNVWQKPLQYFKVISLQPIKINEKKITSWNKKTPQYSKNEDHGIWSHHFKANRWGKNKNTDKTFFSRALKSL